MNLTRRYKHVKAVRSLEKLCAILDAEADKGWSVEAVMFRSSVGDYVAILVRQHDLHEDKPE